MLDLDLAIVAFFLASTLFVGFRFARKVNDIKDYALGGRNFSTATMVSTIVGTWVSGSSFFVTLSHTYSDGLYYLIPSLGMFSSLMIVAHVFVPRMEPYLGRSSVAELMGEYYGNKVRFITALTGSFASAGMVAVQFKAFGNIASFFFDIPSWLAVIFAGTIVTIYSSLGGVRSVTYTDLLQFSAFCIAIPLIGVLIWTQLYSKVDFSISNAFYSERGWSQERAKILLRLCVVHMYAGCRGWYLFLFGSVRVWKPHK